MKPKIRESRCGDDDYETEGVKEETWDVVSLTISRKHRTRLGEPGRSVLTRNVAPFSKKNPMKPMDSASG